MKNIKCALPLTVASLMVLSSTQTIAENHQVNPAFGIVSASTSTDGLFEFNSGAQISKRVLTETRPSTASPSNFELIPGATTKITIQPQTSVLVSLSFTAESRCSPSTTNNSASDWCEVRLMVGNEEAYPQASTNTPDSYAFDSTNSGKDGNASWESHAMDRHLCVTNKSNKFLTIPIKAERKVTDQSGTGGPEFWLDDWSLTIDQSYGCRKRAITK